jgi:hypothetical protein
MLEGGRRGSSLRLRKVSTFALPCSLVDSCRRQSSFDFINPVLPVRGGAFEECVVVFGVKQVSKLREESRRIESCELTCAAHDVDVLLACLVLLASVVEM